MKRYVIRRKPEPPLTPRKGADAIADIAESLKKINSSSAAGMQKMMQQIQRALAMMEEASKAEARTLAMKKRELENLEKRLPSRQHTEEAWQEIKRQRNKARKV